MEKNEIFYELKKRIEETEKRKSDNLNEKEKKLKEVNGFFEKTSINMDINDLKKRIIGLKNFESKLSDLSCTDTNSFDFPKELKEDIQEIISCIEQEDEKQKIRESVKKDIGINTKGKRNEIENNKNDAVELLKKMKMDTHTFFSKNEHMTYQNAVEKIALLLEKELIADTLFLYKDDKQNDKQSLNKNIFEKLEMMVKDSKIEMTDSVKKAYRDIQNLKETQEQLDKINNAQLLIPLLVNTLSTKSTMNFSNTIATLNKINAMLQKKNVKIEKMFSKYNIEDIENLIDAVEKAENEEEKRKDGLNKYKQLAYSLEKIMQEDPDNIEKIEQIKDDMFKMSHQYFINEEDAKKMENEGKEKYYNDIEEEKARHERVLANSADIMEMQQQAEIKLRECAIKELADEGKLPYSQSNNGELPYIPKDKEEMLKNRMNKLRKIMDMSPEERLLKDLKEYGAISEDATISDLTYNQMMDAKRGYCDECYEFIPLFKQVQEERFSRNIKSFAKDDKVAIKKEEAQKIVGDLEEKSIENQKNSKENEERI